MANKTLQLKIGNTTYRSSVDNTLTNEDLNNVTLPGLYNAGGSNSVTNKPSGIDHFGLLVIHRASGSYYIQIIYNDSKSYRRFCVNDTWGNWTEDKLTDTTYTSLKNPHALTLRVNGSSIATYDGSSPITYDVSKTGLGMNKVDNTADVDKSVKHAKTADSATTATTLGTATIGSDSCGVYWHNGKPVKMNATVGGAHTPIYFLNGTATACSLTQADVGLGAVDNTADANKSVKAAAKLQTYKSGNSASTYGDEYPLYARWEENGSTIKLTCDNYTVKTDYATAAGSANSVAWDNVSGKPSSYPPSSHTHTKDSVGLGSVDNTADSAKNVKSATKLQTYKAGSTTETYGDRYPFYVQWQSDNTLKMICDGYKTRVDIADSALPLTGGTLTGQVNFGSGSYYVKADGTANFRTVTGAVYNDYAEFFPRGEATEPGDIVALDLSSDHESYIKATATSKIVAGVHSDEYAMLIGGDKVDDGNYVEKNIEKYIPVSLCGRVFCKCVGKIHRGDTIVVSDIPGVGRAKLPNDYVENTQIIGYAVDEDMNEEIRRVRIRVKG